MGASSIASGSPIVIEAAVVAGSKQPSGDVTAIPGDIRSAEAIGDAWPGLERGSTRASQSPRVIAIESPGFRRAPGSTPVACQRVSNASEI